MIDIPTVRALYRRFDGSGWSARKTHIRVKSGGVEGATYLGVKWALEVIREYAESQRTGAPMRYIPQEPARYVVGGGKRGNGR